MLDTLKLPLLEAVPFLKEHSGWIANTTIIIGAVFAFLSVSFSIFLALSRKARSFIRAKFISIKRCLTGKQRENFLVQMQSATGGVRYFNYSKNNGLILIGADDMQFGVKFSKASNTSIHVYARHPTVKEVARAKDFATGDIIEFDKLDSSSSSYTVQVNEHFIIKNSKGYYMQVRIKSIKDDTRGDAEDEVYFGYQINTDKSSSFIAL